MMAPTRVRYCDAWDGAGGVLAWRVMYQFDPARDRWTPFSIAFETELEARLAEVVLRGDADMACLVE